ncbi:3-hydroxyacyl-CoA dehydrogenase family protein [Fulvivirga sedimenti]|uniref:3-hydroxybutyryl-CoA dehydrogenase n=1 Tax=Fulvivirga sedimenti TaxID=2879465 RepID=A0A9X1L1I7_9BACT|nr:3-hydroxyacyl-CoA dehydrogenase NAD-binding domain-containing protein [Fulvivirga sedimenti]MCA6078272.1 3-hydroxybutyryl-CoA dehydrogenase [Fulvivirga sedimenti]
MNRIAVIGAGTMGLGIAQICGLAGFPTLLFDIADDALKSAADQIEKNLAKGIEKGKLREEEKSAALEKIEFTSDLNAVKADFIIEAIVENLEVKQKLFHQLERQNGAETIMASNTSSIPLTQIARGMKFPNRFIGMHFFNPAHIMKLVEVIRGASTDQETVNKTVSLSKGLGKTPVMAKDSPGFIVNRVARHFYVESLKILEEGVAPVEDIDALIRSTGFKMGPFELMDLIGVDTNFSVTESMFNSFYQDGKFRPSRIQKQKVDAGHHGRKSGKGFYDYS